MVGSVPSRAIRVVHQFLRHGEEGLVDRRKENGIPKVDADLLEALVTILGQSPQDSGYLRPTWTHELLVLVLAERTGVRVSARTVGRMLSRLNARWGRPRATVISPVPEAEKRAKIRRIERLLRRRKLGEEVFYVDEVDIHLNPKLGPDWMLAGTQKLVVTPGVNKKRYLAGALHARTGEVLWVSGEKKNSNLFISLLLKLRRLHPKAKRIHLIVDNFCIHSSKATQQALQLLGGVLKLHFLPPYSPEHNRIERLWKQLHDNVTRNHRCKTIDELMKQALAFLRRASPFPGSRPSVARVAQAPSQRRAS